MTPRLHHTDLVHGRDPVLQSLFLSLQTRLSWQPHESLYRKVTGGQPRGAAGEGDPAKTSVDTSTCNVFIELSLLVYANEFTLISKEV